MNLDITAVDSTGAEQGYSLSAAIAGAAVLSTNPSVLSIGTTTSQLDFDLPASQVSESVNGGATSVVTVVPTSGGMESGAPVSNVVTPNAAPGHGGCGSWSTYKKLNQKTEQFLNLYAYGSATVDEEVGSSEKMGIAITGESGDWGADGSYTVESQVGSGGGDSYSHNDRLTNQANYVEYSRVCYDHKKQKYTEYEAKPKSMAFLLTSATTIVNRAWNINNCHLYFSGHYTKTSGSNQTFSSGVTLGFFNVSAEASFSKDTTVEWFPPAAGEELCGTSSLGFASSSFGGGEAVPRAGCSSPSDVVDTSNDGSASTAGTSPNC